MGNRIIEYEGIGGAGPHAATKVTSMMVGSNPQEIQFHYDDNGNLSKIIDTEGQNTKYSYDFDNLLIGINDQASFVYDGNGVRVKKTDAKTTLYPFALYEIVDGKPIKYYSAAGKIIARRDAGNTGENEILYYHPDHLGSVVMVTGTDGKVAAQADYMPYGEIRDETNPDLLGTYKFTGKELDDSGLYYFGARYYDPEIGKFITPDPLSLHFPELNLGNSQQLNLYSFVLNNPVKFTDAFGLQTDPCSGNSNCTYYNFVESDTDFPMPSGNTPGYPQPGDPDFGPEHGWGETVHLSESGTGTGLFQRDLCSP